MNLLFKAAAIGAVLAVAVFFFHVLFPLLLILLLLGLIRRALFGPRWAYAWGGHGCGACGRHARQRMPTIDGRDWQRPATAAPPSHPVDVV